MATLAIDQSNYITLHQIHATWDSSSYGTQPPNFYAWRLKVLLLEDGSIRTFDDPVWGTHHDILDRFAQSNQAMTYELFIVTLDLSNNQVETQRDSVTVTTSGEDYWIIHPTDPAQTVRLYSTTEDSYSIEHENNTLNLIGRGRKVDTGERWGATGSLTAQLRDQPTTTARQQKRALEQAKDDNVGLTLHTPFGDYWLVFLGDIGFSRVAGVGMREFIDATVPYQEVS